MSDSRADAIDALHRGAREFNRGLFFEAHETWEEAWRPMSGPDRDLFRGLIQLAVAAKKVGEGNANGANRLFERAHRLLVPYSPHRLGIDVAELCRRIARLRDQTLAWIEGRGAVVDLGELPTLPEG